MDYAGSPIRDIESFSRNIVRLNEDVSQLVLKKYSLCLITFEHPQEFIQLKIFHRLFTPWEIMKVLYKLIIMTPV